MCEVVVRNADGKKCVIGRRRNNGTLKLLPEYQELYNILYEQGIFGINPPEAGEELTNFDLPSESEVVLEGTTDGEGFLKLVVKSPQTEDPFYTVDEEYSLVTRYPLLISDIKWSSSADDTKLIIMSPPYASGPLSYDNQYVYPILDLDNRLMIAQGKKGTLETQDYVLSMFVYVDRKCTVALKIRTRVPCRYDVPPYVGDVPLPTYVDVCGVCTPAAYSVLNEDGNIVYTAADGFKGVASLIKSEIVKYKKPNPLLSSTRVSLKEVFEGAIVCQNISFKGFGLPPSNPNQWSIVTQMKDQFGEASPYTDGTYAIGKGLTGLYSPSNQTMIVQCALYATISPNKPLNLLNKLNISLMHGSGDSAYTNIKDPQGDAYTALNVSPIASSDGLHFFYPATFSVRAQADSLAIVHKVPEFGTLESPLTKGAVKITVQSNGDPIPASWDPFAVVIQPFLSTTEIMPPKNMLVCSALTVGGGGSGAYSFNGNIDQFPTTSSGGGGGRSKVTTLKNTACGFLDKETNTYRPLPVRVTVGTGGIPGRILRDESTPARSSSFNVGSVSITAIAGSPPSDLFDGGDDGGGGGTLIRGSQPTYGSGGAQGQGVAGQTADANKGGDGGEGPPVDFFGVVQTASGKEGTPYPGAGGGAGCITYSGVRYGGGGSGGYGAVQPENGEPGLVLLAFKYLNLV